jgi:hypothetical protein
VTVSDWSALANLATALGTLILAIATFSAIRASNLMAKVAQQQFLAIALRNAGNGIAVLHGWRFFPERRREEEHAPLDEFQRQTRDLYIPVGDIGFWQGAFRDPEAVGYAEARKAIEAREPWTLELL